MNKLKQKKLFLLDMDGTLCIDTQLFDGAIELLEQIKKNDGKYIFLTNNSSKSIEKYVEKFKNMGILTATEEDFLTSTETTISYFKENPCRKIYAFGTKSFASQLKEAGLCITEDAEDDVDCLCLGNDTELTFKKLEDACKLLSKGVKYIATNPDVVCPMPYGYVPDCGSFVQIIYNATGKMPKYIGKPEPDMVYEAMAKTGYSPKETVLIGDRLYTDITCGVRAGISTVFVLSGEGTMADLEESEAKPEYILKDIKEVLKAIR